MPLPLVLATVGVLFTTGRGAGVRIGRELAAVGFGGGFFDLLGILMTVLMLERLENQLLEGSMREPIRRRDLVS